MREKLNKIKMLISDDNIPPAILILKELSTLYKKPLIDNRIILLAQRYNHIVAKMDTGLLPSDDFTEVNKVLFGILNIVDELEKILSTSEEDVMSVTPLEKEESTKNENLLFFFEENIDALASFKGISFQINVSLWARPSCIKIEGGLNFGTKNKWKEA